MSGLQRRTFHFGQRYDQGRRMLRFCAPTSDDMMTSVEILNTHACKTEVETIYNKREKSQQIFLEQLMLEKLMFRFLIN